MLIVIHARTSSSRLPNKALKKINEFSILEHVIKRVLRSKLKSKVVIATSEDQSDDSLEQIALEYNLECFRGELKNLNLRLLKLINKKSLNSFVRICGDSPFIDAKIIDEAIALFNSGNFDLVTNTFPRTFPKGQSVEIITRKILEENLAGDLKSV